MTPATMTVPLFPLPDTVFFPHTVLPLHVFEPRYKEMIADSLQGNQMVGVVQLRPGWHDDYFGTPPIFKTLGVGKIVESDRWDDGRYDIVLAGLYRTHINQEIEGSAYRLAEVEILDDLTTEDKMREIWDVHELLLQVYEKLSNALPSDLSILPETDVKSLKPGMLADVMASLLVNDSYERQSLLAEQDVARRQQLLRVQIKMIFDPDHTEEI